MIQGVDVPICSIKSKDMPSLAKSKVDISILDVHVMSTQQRPDTAANDCKDYVQHEKGV